MPPTTEPYVSGNDVKTTQDVTTRMNEVAYNWSHDHTAEIVDDAVTMTTKGKAYQMLCFEKKTSLVIIVQQMSSQNWHSR